MSIFSEHNSSLRLPRILIAVLAILSFTLLLSYNRISSTTNSLFWPDATPISTEPEEDLSGVFDSIPPLRYGGSHRPPMKGLPDKVVADLPEKYIPSHDGRTKRLVIIGDVHGQKTALEKLLGKLHFDKTKDHLILTGDLINKGPDSAGVVDMAIELGAHAVRGNHEDRVLMAHAALDKDSKSQQAASDTVDLETKVYDKAHEEKPDERAEEKDLRAAKEDYLAHEALLDRGDKIKAEVQTARALSRGQIQWLSQLPIILKVGRIPSNKDVPAAFENMVVVHGGLVPNVSLADQDPWAVMTMRSLAYPVDDLRRDAVKSYLEEKASKRNRGQVANSQIDEVQIDEKQIDEYLEKIFKAQGMSGDHEEDDVAVPTAGRDGSKWWKEWNRFQERLAKTTKAEVKAEAEANTTNNDQPAAEGGNGKKMKKDKKKDTKSRRPQTAVERELSGMTVVYGHDAKSGLTVPDKYGNGKGHTFGLDSGCVYGRELSALVIEARAEGVVHGITQVRCDKAADAPK